jgi:YVTN family beta-propeller protein
MVGKVNKALIILLCCLASCVKDKPGAQTSVLPGSTGNAYVVCEGNFGSGNSTLYAYRQTQDSVYGDLYTIANGHALGDVFQSMQRIGDKLLLCINNSDKVVVVRADNWQWIANIAISKPRYVLPVSNDKVYISSLYSNKVYVIDPQSFAVTDTIQMPSLNPEGMCLYNNSAFICNWDTACNNLYKVDIATNSIVQTITLAGYAPQAALVDKAQTLWVLAGNHEKNRRATLTRIDPSTGAILKSYLFPNEADVLKPVLNKTRDTLYYIAVNYYGGTTNNGIYRMGIDDATLPTTPFLQALQYQYFWALGIDPIANSIYVGDPKGFVQKGSVGVYSPDGTKTDSFKVGVGPGHFYFDE